MAQIRSGGSRQVGVIDRRGRLAVSKRVVALLLLSLAFHGQPARADEPAVTEALDGVMDTVRRAWLEDLEDLAGVVRRYAEAGDTYDFIARPNFPYVFDHYSPAELAEERIDTVLIVDRRGAPQFWRRLNHGPGRGFTDARAFLAELPPLALPAAGATSFAGAVQLAEGPYLVAAMPVRSAAHPTAPRGWLIAARPLDDAQWSRYTAAIGLPLDVFNPQVLAIPSGVEAALRAPLAPVLRSDTTHLSGLLAVPGLDGKPFRVLGVHVPRPLRAARTPAATDATPASAWAPWAVILAGGLIVGLTVLLRRKPAVARKYARRADALHEPGIA